MKIHQIEVPEWSDEPIRVREPSIGTFFDLVTQGGTPGQQAIRLVGAMLLNGGDEPVGEDWVRNEVPASKHRGLIALHRKLEAVCGLEGAAQPPPP